MGLKLITAPTVEPVTLAQAKQHLGVIVANDDAMILRHIVAARRHAEQYTGRRLCTQTWEYTRDEFPCGAMELPYPPVASVTSLKYIDANGAEQTLSPSLYQVDTVAEPARIAPAYGESWPDARCQFNAVTVRFVCGYGLTAAVPEDIACAMLLIVGHLFEHREDVSDMQVFQVPRAADALLNFYRIMRF